MADYIYLLENRLDAAQRHALRVVRDTARLRGFTTFLVGGAVRDLTSGSPVRDLDVVVQGNALKLKKDLEKAGAVVTGELEAGQALFLRFPGSVRLEIGSTLSVTYPKPGKAVYRPANILDDLRRRDFTANAMALSLNEGSYGLLMDPLNGVADIDNRQLRLVSNYGFIEDPVRMVRAARLMARLGWDLDEKTRTRYDTGKEEGYISALSEYQRGYETEEIAHEEDPVRVLRRLESEGWMKFLAPYWTAAKVNVPELERLRDVQTQLQVQGLQPDTAAASFPLLTAKLSAKEIESLKASFPRRGFVTEIESLEAEGRDFAAQLGAKGVTQPSQAWRLITQARPEVVLWAEFSTRSPALQARFKSFHTEWPQARTRMPYTLMQEMRIVPDLPGYEALLEQLFFELMDGKLATPEEMKAYLEPHSPPAPPPPVTLRRMRAAKKEAKPSKSRAKKAVKIDAAEEETDAVAAEGTEPDAPAAVPSKRPAAATPVPANAGAKPIATATPDQTRPGVASAAAAESSAAQVSSADKTAQPAKGVPPAKSAVAGKTGAPAKSTTPTQSSAPAKTSAPAEKLASGKGSTSAKGAAPVKTPAPARSAAPARTAAKTLKSASVKSGATARPAAASKAVPPGKAPASVTTPAAKRPAAPAPAKSPGKAPQKQVPAKQAAKSGAAAKSATPQAAKAAAARSQVNKAVKVAAAPKKAAAPAKAVAAKAVAKLPVGAKSGAKATARR